MKKVDAQREFDDYLGISVDSKASDNLYEDSFGIINPLKNSKDWVFANINPRLPNWGITDAEQGEFISTNVGFFVEQAKAKICALKNPLLKTSYDKKFGNLTLSLHEDGKNEAVLAFQAKIVGIGFDKDICVEDIKEVDGKNEVIAHIKMQRWTFDDNKYILNSYEKDCPVTGSRQELVGLIEALDGLRRFKTENSNNELVKTAEEVIITYLEESNTLRVIPTLIDDVRFLADEKEHILNIGGESVVFRGKMSKDMQMLDYIFGRPKEEWTEAVDMEDIYNDLFQPVTEPPFGSLKDKEQNKIVKTIQSYAKVANEKIAPLIGRPNEKLLIASFPNRNVSINKNILKV